MKKILLLMVFCVAFFTLSNRALAEPLLQLDIVDGTYVQGIETIVGMGNLVAILNPAHGTASKVDLGGTFTLVASWDTVQSNSFSLGLAGGTPNDITLDTTPVPTYSQLNHGELGAYGYQLDFSFGSANTTTLYNTQDHPGTFGDWGDDGTALFQMFTIDTTNLDPFVPIHFDLFAETLRDPGKIVFAPPSHDATHAPEPATMLLFGTGLAGLGVFRRKFKKD